MSPRVDAGPEVDGDDLAAVDAALARLVRVLTDTRRFDAMNAHTGADVERSGFSLMSQLERLGPTRLSDLADAADIDVSTASRQVGRLVELGLVGRVPDLDDRRAVRHHLTDNGAAVFAGLRSARRAWLGSALATMAPSQRTAFAGLLGEFVDSIDAIDAAQPRP